MKRIIPALLILILILAACDDGPVGIFASIGSESPIVYKGTEAFKKATPATVVSRNGTLYAIITKLWKKSGTTWKKVTALPPHAMYASAAIVVGSDLYVAFLDADARSLGVFKTSDDSTWTRVDSNFPASGEQVQQLLTANSEIFAVTTRAGSDGKTQYSLYRLTGTSFSTAIKTGSNFFSIAYVGTTYYIASGTTISSTSNFSTFSDYTIPDGNDMVTNIAHIGGRPTAVTANGTVLWHDGSSWTGIQQPLAQKNIALYLHAMVEHNNTLLVATNSVVRKTANGTQISPSVGYVELALPLDISSTQRNESSLVTATSTSFSATLGDKPLSMLTLITENSIPTLYAGSVGNGLWSNRFENGSWTGWQRETD